MALVRVEVVLYIQVLLPHSCEYLVRLSLLHPGVIRALANHQRLPAMFVEQ